MLIPGITMEIEMGNQRKVEVFSAGCPVCEDVVRLVKASACPSCDITVLDTNDIQVAGHLLQTLETVALRNDDKTCVERAFLLMARSPPK